MHVVYERIKKSNSSLNRKSKRLLEDSIERVIAVVRDEEADDDGGSIEGDFQGMDDEAPAKVTYPLSSLNSR